MTEALALDAPEVVSTLPFSELRGLETAKIIDYLVRRHHDPLRANLPPLQWLAAHAAHGPTGTPLLRTVEMLVIELLDAVLPHLDGEEHHVFPVMLGRRASSPEFLREVAAMREESNIVGRILDEIAQATSDFQISFGASAAERTLVARLAQISRELHAHIALEVDVLLPRFES